jgi:hypothetical protein
MSEEYREYITIYIHLITKNKAHNYLEKGNREFILEYICRNFSE